MKSKKLDMPLLRVLALVRQSFSGLPSIALAKDGGGPLRLNKKSKACLRRGFGKQVKSEKQKVEPPKTKDLISILFCNLAACKAFAILFST